MEERGWPFARVGAIPAEGFGSAAGYAFTSNGHRVMAWRESGDKKQEPVVARWTGQTWERLPLPRLESERSLSWSAFSVAVLEDDQTVLAWLESDKSIHVKRFDGTAWQSVGSSPNPERGEVHGLEMALDSAGVPVLAWDQGGKIHVARWEGSAWNGLGGPLSASAQEFTTAGFPAIVARPGLVVLAWSEPGPDGVGDRLLHVWQHHDGAWSALGQPLSAGHGTTLEKALSLNAELEPFVAWAEVAQDGNAVIATSRLTFEGTWTPPELVQDPTAYSSLGALRVTVDQSGSPWVA